jgi:hypothetical protein
MWVVGKILLQSMKIRMSRRTMNSAPLERFIAPHLAAVNAARIVVAEDFAVHYRDSLGADGAVASLQ